MARPEKVSLTDLLVKQNLISQDQLKFVLAEQMRTGRKPWRVLVDNAFVTEEQISRYSANISIFPTSTSSITKSIPS